MESLYTYIIKSVVILSVLLFTGCKSNSNIDLDQVRNEMYNGNYSLAIEKLNQVNIDSENEAYLAKILRATIEFNIGSTDSAINIAIALDDRTIDENYYLVCRGRLFEIAGRSKNALNDYTELIRRDTLNGIYWGYKGSLFYGIENMDSAYKYLSKAVELYAASSEVYNNLAMVEEKTGDSTAALNLYTRAIKFNEDVPGYYANRGLLLRSLGKNKEAYNDFIEVLRISPQDYEIHLNIAEMEIECKCLGIDPCQYLKKASELGSQQAVDMIRTHCNK
jgi:tetratricopeptide (TPR) repeat protein